MIKKEVIHKHAHIVYSHGEHGCAVAYALHEFAGLHIVVEAFSVVLIAGFVLVIIDKFVERI